MNLKDLNIAISNSCTKGFLDALEPKTVNFSSSDSIISFFGSADKDFSLLIFENLDIDCNVLSRILDRNDDFSILYSDYADNNGNFFPLCDYAPGSVRDDFDFGKCMLVDNSKARGAIVSTNTGLKHAGLYDFRLQMYRQGAIMKAESFYSIYKGVGEDFETGHFSYCDPRNRDYQLEAEQVFTKYLKQIGAYIKSQTQEVPGFCDIVQRFKTTASVIIPVKNRPNTIKDAINSALSQVTDFEFNVIVVDNHSDKATSDAIDSIADSRLVHIIPEETDLGIGGCWNKGIDSDKCGAFAIQLDSDDVYSGTHTLQAIVDKFRQEKCGVVIGSYRLTDINMNPLNNLIIDHREYTQENGANNALRVNGFGAPRCYLTPLVREARFKNYSYGEDYDLCLRLCREYKVARIFDVLYLCRRWSGNSDANLSPEAITRNNTLKDSFRSSELRQRAFFAQKQ